jgi:hypothetical protein
MDTLLRWTIIGDTNALLADSVRDPTVVAHQMDTLLGVVHG